MDQKSIMTFPCLFPIKVFGLAKTEFDALVVEIIRRHVPDLSADSVRCRLSQQGQYVSVTVTIWAKSKQQLDDIYLELTKNKKVLMAL